tara:strand:- start:179 stop:556 length:378 start_codon:yes stop_codon:yes gene_type:complete
MAKEITASATLSVKTALGVTADKTDSKKIDMTGDAVFHTIQSVTSSGAAIAYTDAQGNPLMTGEGWVFLKNLSTSLDITIGDDATESTHIILLKPGEFALFRANRDLYADCASGTGTLEMLVLEP